MTGALTSSIRLVAMATAVARARRFTTETLRMWNLSAVAVDDACLITSELVTNAVRATGTLELNPSPETLAGLPDVELKLVIARRRLLIEVADASSKPPHVQQRCETSLGGRGLILVAGLAERWSYFPVGGGGKVV